MNPIPSFNSTTKANADLFALSVTFIIQILLAMFDLLSLILPLVLGHNHNLEANRSPKLVKPPILLL